MDTIVLAAMVMLLIGGMFDLSVDGVVNMTGVIIGALLVAGISVWLSIASGIAAALIVGLVNGIAVTKFKMNPLMTTLGTWWVTQGLAFGVTQGLSSHSFPQRFIDIGYAAPFGVTMPIWYAVVSWSRSRSGCSPRPSSAIMSTPPGGTAKVRGCMASRSIALRSPRSCSSRWQAR